MGCASWWCCEARPCGYHDARNKTPGGDAVETEEGWGLGHIRFIPLPPHPPRALPSHSVAPSGRGSRFRVRLLGGVARDRGQGRDWRAAAGAPTLAAVRRAARSHTRLVAAPRASLCAGGFCCLPGRLARANQQRRMLVAVLRGGCSRRFWFRGLVGWAGGEFCRARAPVQSRGLCGLAFLSGGVRCTVLTCGRHTAARRGSSAHLKRALELGASKPEDREEPPSG